MKLTYFFGLLAGAAMVIAEGQDANEQCRIQCEPIAHSSKKYIKCVGDCLQKIYNPRTTTTLSPATQTKV